MTDAARCCLLSQPVRHPLSLPRAHAGALRRLGGRNPVVFAHIRFSRRASTRDVRMSSRRHSFARCALENVSVPTQVGNEIGAASMMSGVETTADAEQDPGQRRAANDHSRPELFHRGRAGCGPGGAHGHHRSARCCQPWAGHLGTQNGRRAASCWQTGVRSSVEMLGGNSGDCIGRGPCSVVG